MFDKLLKNRMFTFSLSASGKKIMKNFIKWLKNCLANENDELEDAVYQWIIVENKSELTVSTVDVTKKVFSIHSQSKNNNQGALFLWVCRYLKR